MDKFIKIFSAVFTLLGALFFFPGLYLLWRFGIAVIAFPLVGFVFMIVGLSFLLGARSAAAKLRKLRETGRAHRRRHHRRAVEHLAARERAVPARHLLPGGEPRKRQSVRIPVEERLV